MSFALIGAIYCPKEIRRNWHRSVRPYSQPLYTSLNEPVILERSILAPLYVNLRLRNPRSEYFESAFYIALEFHGEQTRSFEEQAKLVNQ